MSASACAAPTGRAPRTAAPRTRSDAMSCSVSELSASPTWPSSPAARPAPKTMKTAMPLAVVERTVEPQERDRDDHDHRRRPAPGRRAGVVGHQSPVAPVMSDRDANDELDVDDADGRRRERSARRAASCGRSAGRRAAGAGRARRRRGRRSASGRRPARSRGRASRTSQARRASRPRASVGVERRRPLPSELATRRTPRARRASRARGSTREDDDDGEDPAAQRLAQRVAGDRCAGRPSSCPRRPRDRRPRASPRTTRTP